MTDRVKEALEANEPTDALWRTVIEALTVDGLSRESVMAELLEQLEDARAAGNEAAVRALGNVIDCLIGWSSPEFSLERVGFSEFA